LSLRMSGESKSTSVSLIPSTGKASAELCRLPYACNPCVPASFIHLASAPLNAALSCFIIVQGIIGPTRLIPIRHRIFSLSLCPGGLNIEASLNV
jgi:hypothetical protein